MLLLWSGGCDSTLVLANELRRKDRTSETIRTLSITMPQLNHNKEQWRARKAIIAHYKKRKIFWPHVEVEIRKDYPCGFENFVQMSGHPMAIMFGIAMPYLDTNEDLCLSLIKSDNAIHWLTHIENAFEDLQKASFRTGKLNIPLEWHTKARVIHDLKKHRLLNKTWWCESPHRGRMCGECQPCMTHKTAKLVLQHELDYQLHGLANRLANPT